MALVNYVSSDSSEFEDDEPLKSNIATGLNETVSAAVYNNTYADDSKNDHNSTESVIFKLLPQPSKKRVTLQEEDDEFLLKKEPGVKPKARITVPSLNDFKDVESTVVSKPKLASTKKSGLLSMLPQPKNTVTASVMSKTLVPHVLTQKASSTPAKKKISVQPTSHESATSKTNKTLELDYSDDDDEEDVQNDFFSINKLNEKDNEFVIENERLDNIGNITNITKPCEQKVNPNINAFLKVSDSKEQHIEIQPDASVDDHYNHSDIANIESSSNATEMELDEEAIRKLVGARGRRKREQIQIVDVNQQEVLEKARETFMKGLLEDTSKRVSSSKRKGNEPTNQQRRKHQITYLAHQAKANEIELQNQWANSRVSRRQTQSKYGF